MRGEPDITRYDSLNCDHCGIHIGWVYENDLNGSGFMCDACRTEELRRCE